MWDPRLKQYHQFPTQINGSTFKKDMGQTSRKRKTTCFSNFPLVKETQK